jgi:PAS domain S-box-containing protein
LEARLEDPAEEVKRLKRCVNDVVSVVALPAMWAGSEPSQIVRTLVDVLLGVLDPDLVYALLKGENGEPLIEMARFSSVWEVAPQPREIGAVLHKWLGDNPQEWPTVVRKPFRERDISVVPLRLGLQDEFGLIVAGSQRTDFPQQTERLILQLAANQAAIGLQEARILSEQKKIAHELERQVAERTARIAAANEDLRKEIAERKEAEAKLRRSEADLLEAQRLTQTCSWKHDIPSGRVSVSPEALRMFGVNSGEDTSDAKCWFDKIHPEDRRRIQSLFEKSETEKTSYEADYRVVHPDGSIRYQHSVGRPVLNGSGELVEFIGTAVDVTEQVQARAALQKAFDEIEKSEAKLRQVIETIPALAWSARPDGPAEFFNRPWLEYAGLSYDQARDVGWVKAVHPDDLNRLMEYWRSILVSGKPGEIEARLRRFDGEYRWFLFQANPLRDKSGTVVKWYGTNVDIEDRKRAEQKLRESEENLRTLTDAIRQSISVLAPDGTILYTNQVFRETTGVTIREGNAKTFLTRVFHPDDLGRILAERQEGLSRGTPFEFEARVLMKNGQYRWGLIQYNPLKDERGKIIRWYSTGTDIDDRKRSEQELKRSEAFLAEGQRLSRTGSFSWCVATNEITWSEELYRIFEFDESLPVTLERIASRVYPDDLPLLRDMIERARGAASDFEYQHRLLMPDQSVKHIHLFAHPTRDKYGRLEYVGAAQDVTDFHTITDAIANPVLVLTPDGITLYANRVALNQSGLTPSEAKNEGFFPRACHPDDIDRVRDGRREGFMQGIPFEMEVRLLKSGEYRWQLIQYNPLKDESGKIIRWYATATDIDDRKKTEERLQNENLVLREEINSSSMFEDIVGSSEPLRKVLTEVSKVAPSDSTVLILGETGTGKELIARAIHKRSSRASRAFVGVSCAAIPPSLIASELFGHEKGAFTGATQRRLGRFETANGGTILLDEVGDLPLDIQIALLRVLQEREIERVGSDKPIPVDVRVVAATHRDLNVLVSEGKFRQDLLYRLNVVPIQMPSLRERAADIPLLVEYFIARFGSKAGKKFRTIDKRTLKLLQAYEWPGNVRELQNVIERAVILTDSDCFAVDETWFRQERSEVSRPTVALTGVLLKQEKQMIETALREAGGVVGGPTGAAAKLGIPRETLNSKIRKLGIKRNEFRAS